MADTLTVSRRSSCACRLFWAAGAARSCSLRHGVGAGTSPGDHVALARSPALWRGLLLQPFGAGPPDGRYGETPTGCSTSQFQVLIKPFAPDLQDIYLGALKAIGSTWRARHPLGSSGMDGESPARRWGWVGVCGARLEVRQFTYFQQVRRALPHRLGLPDLYVLERLGDVCAGGIDHCPCTCPSTTPSAPIPLSYRRRLLPDRAGSIPAHNFDAHEPGNSSAIFRGCGARCRRLLDHPARTPRRASDRPWRPGYDQCIKAASLHLLDGARRHLRCRRRPIIGPPSAGGSALR